MTTGEHSVDELGPALCAVIQETYDDYYFLRAATEGRYRVIDLVNVTDPENPMQVKSVYLPKEDDIELESIPIQSGFELQEITDQHTIDTRIVQVRSILVMNGFNPEEAIN